ncbi:uncharacterized protein isoform X2 [Leptinotarsa decemlineata]|uniref:uncharacterized protein isoform X2 n=1 Tax=Leptinotarsa decemlineata TaxID=7539 RepID=UPI003D3077F2
MEVSEKLDCSCRLCDETSEKMFGIFEKNEEGIQILQLIKECLPIIIYRTDPLSKQICESCYYNLNSLSAFKKNALKTADNQKDKLKTDSDPDDRDVQLFLGCGEDMDEASELKDASTSTDDLTVFCNRCKQALLDGNVVNGELELCTDLHKAIAESLVKNKVNSESASEKLLRRRKVVPFYHELEDSLCSSLTEFTHNTEGSQCFEENSDTDDSIDSDEIQRPRKRRRMVFDDDKSDENQEDSGESSAQLQGCKEGMIMIRKPSDINGDREEDLENMFADEEEFRYQPLSLLQLTLNVINKTNVPGYEPDEFTLETIWPNCNYCGVQYPNLKVLAIHEASHIDIEMGEKIDNPIPWHSSREYAEVRNKWLNYFDENGYEDEDIVIDDIVSTDNLEDTGDGLLIPVDDKEGGTPAVLKQLTGDEQIVLDGTQPMVNNVYLGDYSKDDRKLLYQSMRVQGVNKKFCPLCRYTFKDNWAIESHYFSLACYYTCRYCGMRFNKQRHKFTEHVDEHKAQNHDISEKVYAASKLSNIIPKVIHPPKPRRIVVTQHNPPPQMLAQNSQQQNATLNSLLQQQQQFNASAQQPVKLRSFMERKTLQPNLQNVKIKEEPQDQREVITSQSITGNQAFFCRKCYKVFFKLDEFNIHSKQCDYNQFPQSRNLAPKPGYPSKNGEVSPAGRPLRNCAKEIGPYKDEAYLPDSVLKEPKQQSSPQSFVCFICNTPFPTIYSRNSHMRIHKGETQGNNFKPRIHLNQLNYRMPPQHQNNQHYQQHHQQQQQPMMPVDVMIKQEPMDMPMEPMVEIHEPEQGNFPDSIGDGAVSITPISKNPKQRPTINPNVMKIVQSNPNLSIKKSPEKFPLAHPQMPSGSHLQMLSLPDPDRTYKCSSCWEAFANKSHLYFHKKNQCEGSRLPCPFCKKRFGTEAEYSSHIYYSHPE